METIVPEIQIGKDAGDVRFVTDQSINDEGYILDVADDGIAVKASSNAGFFYNMQSLHQLLPVSLYSENTQNFKEWKITAVHIEDEPAFEWRGFMLDVSRHFFEPERIKEVIDFMAELKLNRFHWHLTEDQGWMGGDKELSKAP